MYKGSTPQEIGNELAVEAAARHMAPDIVFTGFDASAEYEVPGSRYSRKLMLAAVSGIPTFAVDSYIPKRNRTLLGRRLGSSAVFHSVRERGEEHIEINSLAVEEFKPVAYAETFLVHTTGDDSIIDILTAIDNPFMGTKTRPGPVWQAATKTNLCSMREVLEVIDDRGSERVWEAKHVRPSQRKC